MSLPQVADATASSAELSPSAAPAPGRPALAGASPGRPGPGRPALRAEPGGHPAGPDLRRGRAGHGGPGQPGLPDLARLVGGGVGVPRRDRADHGPRPGGGPAARPAVTPAGPGRGGGRADRRGAGRSPGSPAPGPSSGCPSASVCARRCSSPAWAPSSRNWRAGPGSPGPTGTCRRPPGAGSPWARCWPGCSPRPGAPAWRWARSPPCTGWARSGCGRSRWPRGPAGLAGSGAHAPGQPGRVSSAGRSAPGCASCGPTARPACWCWWSR